jgi:hypothetical protein
LDLKDEFPSFGQAQAWYYSPEYAPLKVIRWRTCATTPSWWTSWPTTNRLAFSNEDWARLDALSAEAERRGVPTDRFHPGEPIESVLAASEAESAGPPVMDAAAETREPAQEQVLALLPARARPRRTPAGHGAFRGARRRGGRLVRCPENESQIW